MLTAKRERAVLTVGLSNRRLLSTRSPAGFLVEIGGPRRFTEEGGLARFKGTSYCARTRIHLAFAGL